MRGARDDRFRRKRAVLALCGLAVAVTATACAAPEQPAATEPAQTAAPVELRVSAATSLKSVLERTAPEFEADNDVRIVFNFGASGVLQKQIEGGAPVDVFVSASPKQVASLTAGSLISADTTSTFAGNDVVVFVPKGDPAGVAMPEDLKKAGRIVTGNPETAPHGAKAKEWLEGLDLWEELKPKMVFAENAAQTLDYVARGEVDAGIGFASEALSSPDVEIVYTVPGSAIKPVRYVAAPLVAAEHPEAAAAYVAFLTSPSVQQALTGAGFLPAPAK